MAHRAYAQWSVSTPTPTGQRKSFYVRNNHFCLSYTVFYTVYDRSKKQPNSGRISKACVDHVRSLRPQLLYAHRWSIHHISFKVVESAIVCIS